MRALLIVSCVDGRKWYSGLVGCVVPYGGDEGNEYRSREPEGYINYIAKNECVVVEGEPLSKIEYYSPIV